MSAFRIALMTVAGALCLAPIALTLAEESASALGGDKKDSAERLVVTEEEGLKAFEDIYAAATHPRCMNCHPSGDAPLQTDQSVPHSMAITRMSPTVGLMCSTCHREVGLKGIAHLPPADPQWRMPPKEMAFEGRSLNELCHQLRDKEQTGGRDLDMLVEHVAEDHLLQTSWHSGREAPPVTHSELVDRFLTWAEAGAPCPDEGQGTEEPEEGKDGE